MRVVVVGGGVAGLCCAWSLRKRGAEVTIVEGGRVGSGASFGNGGWVCPAQAGPVPEPGLTAHGLRALVNADSALYFKPGYLPRLAPWLLRFRRYCNEPAYRRGVEALARLGERAFELYDAFAAEGVEFELYKLGMVYAARDEADARAGLEKLRPLTRFGFRLPERLVTGAELHDLEPALAARVTAGFLVEQHWHVRADTVTHGLAEALRVRGVEIVEGTAVTGFETRDGVVRAARTTRGEYSGDAFVLAAGAPTTQLAATLGVRLRQEAGKGYSFFIRPDPVPRHAILFTDIHAGCTPLGDRVRVSGTMEFSGFNTDIDRRRIGAIMRLAREFLVGVAPEVEGEWAGMRPLTPDGLPVLDRAGRLANAYLATGYSMLGMTVAPTAGEAMAELILTGERPALLEPFRLERFSRRGARAAAARRATRS